MRLTPLALSLAIVAPVLVPVTVTVSAAPTAAAAKTHYRHASLRRMTRKARAEALNVLFTQLKNAPDEGTAQRLATAIEKIWRRSGSDTADLMMERAGMALLAQKYDLAIKLLGSLTRMAPSYAEGWNQLATVHFLRNDYGHAVRDLRRVLTLEPRHFKALEGLAIILRETGSKKAALKALRHLLTIHPRMKSAKQAEEELAREVEGQSL